MKVAYYLPLVLLLSTLISATKNATSPVRGLVPAVGCNLEIPNHVKNQLEARGSPLVIFVDLKVLSVKNILDSGGSYEMDIK